MRFILECPPPSWGKHNSSNLVCLINRNCHSREREFEMGKIWPRCSGWDDVIWVPGRGERGPRNTWALGIPPRRVAARVCSQQGEPAPELIGLFLGESRSAIHRKPGPPPCRQNRTPSVPNWEIVKQTPTPLLLTCTFFSYFPSVSYTFPFFFLSAV